MPSPEEQFQQDHDAIMAQLLANVEKARERGEMAFANQSMEIAVSMAVSFRSVNANASIASKAQDARNQRTGGIGGFMGQEQ